MDGFFGKWEPNSQEIRLVVVDKPLFYETISYRVDVLRTLENALVEGFYAIKGILGTIFDKLLPDTEGIAQYFPAGDADLLGFRVAERLLGTLPADDPANPRDYSGAILSRRQS